MWSTLKQHIFRYASPEMISFLVVFAIAAASIVVGAKLLPWQPILGDEWAYAERSYTLVDTLHTPFQTTPFDWWGEAVPWWTRLSFHDHPPLQFWLRHFFAVPQTLDILAFAASILLMYGLTWQLLSRRWAMYAALLFSVSVGPRMFSLHVMIESLLLALTLASALTALLAYNDRRYLALWGFIAGLGMITKYTFAAPLLAEAMFLIFVCGKKVFKEKYLWYGVVLFFVTISPVAIYNLMLFFSVGHFDMQIAFALGQDTPEWTAQLGKLSRGGLIERVLGVGVALQMVSMVTWLMSMLLVLRMAVCEHRPCLAKPWLLPLLMGVSILGFNVFAVGSDPRFMMHALPWFILGIIWLLSHSVLPGRAIYLVAGLVFLAELTLTTGTLMPGRDYRVPGITVSPPVWYAHGEGRAWWVPR